jgi:hypothetical protein
MAVWCSLWSFGILSRFGMFGPKKSGNPDTTCKSSFSGAGRLCGNPAEWGGQVAQRARERGPRRVGVCPTSPRQVSIL